MHDLSCHRHYHDEHTDTFTLIKTKKKKPPAFPLCVVVSFCFDQLFSLEEKQKRHNQFIEDYLLTLLDIGNIFISRRVSISVVCLNTHKRRVRSGNNLFFFVLLLWLQFVRKNEDECVRRKSLESYYGEVG